MRAGSTPMLLLLLTSLATPVSADPPRLVPSAAGDAAPSQRTGAEEEQRRDAGELALIIAARLEEQERLDSPRWAIASAARVGAMWGDLHRALRALPVPSSWGAGDLGASYYHTPLDSPGEEARWRAKKAFAVCVRLGIRYRILDEHTQACEAWLTRHYHHEHPGLPELFAPPSFRSAGFAARPAPLPPDR